jgi:benzylsuccinate CoA-transferase BbsF subunit
MDGGLMEGRRARDGALRGIRICDFSGLLAGAGATRVLAVLGAEVIRVEDPVNRGLWDWVRGGGPFVDERRGIELGGMFNNINVEKLGITLNMRLEKGKDLLRRLIAISDVVTENFSAGVMDRWGFSYEHMSRIKPDIIYLSSCGFGHTGPYKDFKTIGPIVQAVSGLHMLSGLPGRDPAGWGYSYMDHMGANLGALAVLAAIFRRNRTGEGQWIDLAMTEAAGALAGPFVLDNTVNGRRSVDPANFNSNRSPHPARAPHGIYRCAGDDRWVAIAVRDDHDWDAFCVAVGAEWCKASHFSTVTGRIAHQDELDACVESWTSVQSPQEAMCALQAHGVPSAAVQTPEERVAQDENTREWDLFPFVDHPVIGRVRVDGFPLRLSRTPYRIRYGAPLLGQDNDYVYGDLLGITQEERDALRQEAVIS